MRVHTLKDNQFIGDMGLSSGIKINKPLTSVATVTTTLQTGVMASSSALQTALDAQFQEDGVSLEATVESVVPIEVNGVPIGPIVGGAAGGAVVVLALVLVWWFCLCKKKKANKGPTKLTAPATASSQNELSVISAV